MNIIEKEGIYSRRDGDVVKIRRLNYHYWACENNTEYHSHGHYHSDGSEHNFDVVKYIGPLPPNGAKLIPLKRHDPLPPKCYLLNDGRWDLIDYHGSEKDAGNECGYYYAEYVEEKEEKVENKVLDKVATSCGTPQPIVQPHFVEEIKTVVTKKLSGITLNLTPEQAAAVMLLVANVDGNHPMFHGYIINPIYKALLNAGFSYNKRNKTIKTVEHFSNTSYSDFKFPTSTPEEV